PLYQLLSVPFILLFGRSEDAAVAVNLLFTALLLWATYGTGRLARNGWTGLLAAFLVAAYPPLLHLSRMYRPQAALPACVAVSLFLLLLLLNRRSIGLAWLFGVSLGAGMWMHLNFFYFLPVPAAGLGLYMLLFQAPPRRPPSLKGTPRWLLRKLGDPFVLFGLLPAALIAAGLAAAWYLPHSQAIFELQREVESNYSFARGFGSVPHNFWWYVLTAPGALSTVQAFLLGLGLILCLGLGLARRRLAPLVLVVTFVLLYLFLGQRVGDLGWLHFAPALAVAAALTAVGLGELQDLGLPRWPSAGRWLSTVGVLGGVATAALTFATGTWGLQPWSRPLVLALGSPLDTITCTWRMHLAFCPDRAAQDDWHVDDILETVLDDPQCLGSPCQLAVVPADEYFNPMTFDSYLDRLYPQSRDQVVIHNPGGWAGWPGDGQWLASHYLLFVPTIRHPGYGREIRAEITAFLESPPPDFAELYRPVAAFPLPEGMMATLLKRSQPLTIDRAIPIYEQAHEQVPSDGALCGNLGTLYLRAGDESRAEERLLEATRIAIRPGPYLRALGTLYQDQGREEQAVAAFRQAIKQEPFEPRSYRHLADLFEARGDWQPAALVYEQAIRDNPRLAWPHLDLGALYVRAGLPAGASAAYQAALRVDPWNETARANLDDPHWSLASSLGTLRAYAGDTPLDWWQDETWVRPYPDPPDTLVGRSVVEAGGQVRPDQIFFHPAGASQATRLSFDVRMNQYDALQVGYSLADQVAGLSNGVRLTLQASVDGGGSYTTLWQEHVTGSAWQVHTLPLVEYWGQDLSFRLDVDALGDDSYDWLQTTVRLFPAVRVWDLAANLASVQVAGPDAALVWDGTAAWQDGNGRSLVTLSHSPVQGAARHNQVQFHPFGQGQDTVLTWTVEDNPYTGLRTTYAMADEAAGQSDGVDLGISVSIDGGRTFTPLLESQVVENTWQAAMLDLAGTLGQDLVVQLRSSSRGSDNYDWLQVTVALMVPSSTFEASVR
ncbi:MAG: tetratricopeptide repeat protein, partial [Anaerolineae bacterium]|nr:tetratricopeptide repeat protein [Anaerolineae bacterium]